MKFLKRSEKPETGDEKVKYYHSKYVNYSRAIAVLWAVLVICFLIIALVCLIQPTWLGAARDAPGAGYFGLWRYFTTSSVVIGSDQQRVSLIERGEFLNFDLIPSTAFKAATAFVGLTVLLTAVCILCFFLFCCINAKIVFIICGWILVVDAVFMFLACVIYPAGWDAEPVRLICNSSDYNSNKCYILWAYILAIIGIFDAIVLAVLAFVLAYRHVRLLPWQAKGGEKVYVVDDDRDSGVKYVEPVRVVQTQPVVYVDQRSDRSQPLPPTRHKKSSKHNFSL